MELDGLFLGLGNPGPTYANTRHNCGFMLADAILDACARNGDINRLSGGKKLYEAWQCRLPVKGSPLWIIAKPQTFMNKSGEAAVSLLQYYKIPLANLVAAHDELDLPLGKIRLKFGGGTAGHNGVKSIAACTGSQDFYRIRLGIGKPEGYEVTSFVLGKFAEQERRHMEKTLDAAAAGFFTFCEEGFPKAQRQINGFTISPE